MRGKQDRKWRTVRIVAYLLVILGPLLMLSARGEAEDGEVWAPVAAGALSLCSGVALVRASQKHLRNAGESPRTPHKATSPTHKAKPSLSARVGQWIRVHRGLSVAAGAAVVTIVVGSIVIATMGVTKDDHYRSADALRSALDSEGFRCASPESSSLANGYGEEINCEDGLRIATWEEDIPDYADDPTMLSSMQTMFDRHVLLSDTWSISSTNRQLLLSVQEIFGGEFDEAQRLL